MTESGGGRVLRPRSARAHGSSATAADLQRILRVAVELPRGVARDVALKDRVPWECNAQGINQNCVHFAVRRPRAVCHGPRGAVRQLSCMLRHACTARSSAHNAPANLVHGPLAVGAVAMPSVHTPPLPGPVPPSYHPSHASSAEWPGSGLRMMFMLATELLSHSPGLTSSTGCRGGGLQGPRGLVAVEMPIS